VVVRILRADKRISRNYDIRILRTDKKSSCTFDVRSLRTATRAAPCSGYLRTYTSYSVTSISSKKQTTAERSKLGDISSSPELAQRLLLLLIIQTSATCRARPSWPSASYGQTRESLATTTFAARGHLHPKGSQKSLTYLRNWLCADGHKGRTLQWIFEDIHLILDLEHLNRDANNPSRAKRAWGWRIIQAATASRGRGHLEEMHVTSAERSEPGKSTACKKRRKRSWASRRDARNPSRAKRAWGWRIMQAGPEEVGSISTEMQITPAERSEPGDRESCRQGRPRRGRGHLEEMHVTPAERSEPGDRESCRQGRPRRGREHLDRDASNP